jgi:molybdopterin/thiamine biosynthesis adenylyltransferase
VVDHDAVDLTNLQRQIAHDLSRLGAGRRPSRRATACARSTPTPRCWRCAQRADAPLLHELVARSDVVLDCSDNFATRHASTPPASRTRKPLVAAAALGFDAQVSVYDTARSDAPATPACSRRGAGCSEAACADHGRVRAAGGHRGQHAGRPRR